MEVVVKIRSISAYQADLPLHEGSYNWSGGKSVSVFDSTIVAIETDEGVTGYGEVCPLGPFYLPAYAEGARTGITELAPHLIGEDPTQLLPLNRHMDAVLKGHPYVKSAIDMACWDILGKISSQSVCTLLGGRYGEDFMLYRAISQQSPEEMARKVAKAAITLSRASPLWSSRTTERRELDGIEGEMKQKSAEIRGEADAEVIKLTAEAYGGEALEFYEFLRRLEVFKTALGSDTRLIMSTDSDLFQLLKNPGVLAPQPDSPSVTSP